MNGTWTYIVIEAVGVESHTIAVTGDRDFALRTAKAEVATLGAHRFVEVWRDALAGDGWTDPTTAERWRNVEVVWRNAGRLFVLDPAA